MLHILYTAAPQIQWKIEKVQQWSKYFGEILEWKSRRGGVEACLQLYTPHLQ